jgi:hypothetical protein
MTDAGESERLAVRYYQWALGDMEREIREDFPLLRPIKGSLAMRFVAFMERLPAGDRDAHGVTLVKRFHQQARQALGHSWDAADEARVTRYRQSVHVETPAEAPYMRNLLANPRSLKVDRDALLKAAAANLAGSLGDTGRPSLSKRDSWFETPLGDWRLITEIDVGGTVHQLSYLQRLQRPNGPFALDFVSVLAWLGIGGQTYWDRVTDADIPKAAASLARACEHFARAAPGLLA